MEAQELALLEKVKTEMTIALKGADKSVEIAELKTALAAAVTKRDIDAIVLKLASTEITNDLLLKLEAVALELKSLKEAKQVVSANTLKGALEQAFELKKDEIAKILKDGQKAAFRLDLKVDPMLVDNTIGSGSTFNTITENTGIIAPTRKRELTYIANVSVGSINSNRAVWIEETTESGTPIMLGEGDAKTQLASVWVESTMSVKKIAVYGKVSTELMADLPQLISYIQSNLMKRMDIVLEGEFFSGVGTGDHLKGVITYATAFTPGSLAATIVTPNAMDVIEAVATQVKKAFGLPNAIFIHPDTMAQIKLVKDSAGRPIWKDYVTTNGMMNISGMNVIETTAITSGDYVGGDMSVVHVLNRSELGIQIGLDGSDFTNNLKTMLVEKRVVQFVSANDTGCLVTGTFADDIITLTAV